MYLCMNIMYNIFTLYNTYIKKLDFTRSTSQRNICAFECQLFYGTLFASIICRDAKNATSCRYLGQICNLFGAISHHNHKG